MSEHFAGGMIVGAIIATVMSGIVSFNSGYHWGRCAMYKEFVGAGTINSYAVIDAHRWEFGDIK